jgi:SAM-dependent methyltransferase
MMRRDRNTGIPTTLDVRAFWEGHPVAAASIHAEPGAPEFYVAFDRLRNDIESEGLQGQVYRYADHRQQAVLEVGCGNGYLLSRYARHGARAWGIDLTRTAVELARRRFDLGTLRGHFAQADAQCLPFQDASFDLVVSAGVLHHVPDIAAAIAEIYRVLKPGGRFVIMLYHRDSIHYRLLYPLYGVFHSTFRGKGPATIAREIDGVGNPIGRPYTRQEVRRLLAAFREVRFQVGSLPVPGLRALAPGRALLGVLAKWLGWFLYARAVK